MWQTVEEERQAVRDLGDTIASLARTCADG